MYAIIEDSGTQIKVAQGEVIRIDPRELPEDAEEVTFDRVLALGGGEGEPRIGAPVVEGASVSGRIIEEGRGEKVEVVKFRRRQGYARRRSHRQGYMKVRIMGIHES